MCVFTYCVIFSSILVSLTKCVNSPPPSLIILQLFSVEKTILYVYEVNVFIGGEKQIFSRLLYSICEELKLFLFLWGPEKNMPNGKKENISIISFNANIAPKWDTMISCKKQGL